MMNSKRNLWIVLSSTALVIMGTLSLGYYEYSKANEDPSEKRPEIYIAAAALLQEFSQSEENANAKFFNKITCAKGILKRIDKDRNEILSLALDSGDSS